ncbi:MAG: beta-propeller fold lactonase family protein [Gammaproteobacteria bacterium]|nr:beta-propeller fold lactonase family protein [Gammaproteobacteria bacterium]
MNNKLIKRLLRGLFVFFVLSITAVSYGLPFTIVTKSGTALPAALNVGDSVNAYYTVTNNTAAVRLDNYIKHLPLNVTQVTNNGTFPDTCATNFNLAAAGSAGDSCTLQLRVTGPVNGNDPDPKHHLVACGPQGLACAGTKDTLNVIQIPRVVKAYNANGIGSTATICGLDSKGGFNNCENEAVKTSAPLLFLIGSAFNLDHSRIYFTELSQNTVVYCNVDNKGKLSNCNLTGGGFTHPTSIAFNNTATIAYVSNGHANNVSYCKVKSDGSFEDCATTGNDLSGAYAIALNPDNTRAYITDPGDKEAETPGKILMCAVNPHGDFSNCKDAGLSDIDSPFGITISPAGNIAYIAADIGDGLYYCKIQADGELSNCAVTGSGFNNPATITINAAGTIAYITNPNDNSVSYCEINSNGKLSNCTETGSDYSNPISVALG